MLKRPEQIVKLICLLLAVVLGIELVRVFTRGTPLKNLTVPALPKLAFADSTNSPAGGTAKSTNANVGTNASGTNASAGTNTSSGTNTTTAAKNGTNASLAKTDAKGTNATADTKAEGTNVAKAEAEWKPVSTADSKSQSKETNSTGVASTTNQSSSSSASESATTNHDATLAKDGTNAATASAKRGTNASGTNGTNSVDKTAQAGTNSPSAQKSLAKGSGPGGRPDMGKKGPDVPPAMKSRIDRIIQSEILAPVMRPMPMALLGIAGDQAFLRSPEGQTGLIKEGAELGTIKLLKVGTNRVLIEEKGEKKELMIFSGLGGDSLMPKEEKKAKDDKKGDKPEPKKNEEKEKKPNETPKKAA